MNDSTVVLQLDFPEPDIARITWNDPARPVNVITRQALDQLARLLDQLEQQHSQKTLAGLVICSAKPSSFLGGADLQELASRWATLTPEKATAGSQRGQALFHRLSTLPFVTVAVIAGSCLGGGAELASWCDFRVVADNPRVEIGFPEVQLGIIPAWGGSTRLPRLIGLGPALEWISTGNPVSSSVARHVRWADQLVEVSAATVADPLLAAAIRRIRAAPFATPAPHSNTTFQTTAADQAITAELTPGVSDMPGNSSSAVPALRARRRAALGLSENELGLLRIAATTLLRPGPEAALRAPRAAIELLLQQATLGEAQALREETNCFVELSQIPTVSALLNVFLLRKRSTRWTDSQPEAPPHLNEVGVIGAGIMGAGIAAAHLKHGISVHLHDAAPERLAQAAREVVEEAAYNRDTKQVDPQRAIRCATALNTSHDLNSLTSSELVIEAIVESAEAKRVVFQQLESLVAPQTILATNTSTIPITKLAARLQHPDRFIGLHFFNPVRRMPLVEVIRGEQTSDRTIATVVAHAKRIGKMPIVVRDGPGFLVNRLLFPYMNEALELLCDGAQPEAIERAARQFGMPLGPLELYDMVGLDTAVYAGRVMWEAFPQRVRPLPLIPALIKSGRLGQKSGQGFFRYDSRSKQPQMDATVLPLLKQYQRQEHTFTHEEITRRLFLPMLIEAALVLQDGIVTDPRDIDFGLVFGLGFPSFRGGLLYWADRQGYPALVRQIEEFTPLGERFAVPELLQALARRQGTMYACEEGMDAAEAGRMGVSSGAVSGVAR